MYTSSMNLSDEIKKYASEIGFHIVKIIPADAIENEGRHLQDWLDDGLAGDLDYMKKDASRRSDPGKILPNVKSIICLAMNYYQESSDSVARPGTEFAKGEMQSARLGKVARYAWGKDYHSVIEKKLKKLRTFIIEKVHDDLHVDLQKNDFKIYSDAGPLLERAYAARAGIGVVGKNGMLITQKYGSWVFLAELLTSLELDFDEIVDESQHENADFSSCGTCTKCMDACPMNAIIAPGKIDARKCISYQTIENRGEISDEVYEKMGDRIFGCDICQEVCPHNCRAQQTDVEEFLDHRAGPNLDIDELNRMGNVATGQAEFDEKYKGSPIRRTGLKGLIRNVKNMLKSARSDTSNQ
jgi:epoxyqueuosine reductase